jgi:hypothetical protein
MAREALTSSQGCQIFSIHTTQVPKRKNIPNGHKTYQNGKNIQNDSKTYQNGKNIPNDRKTYQNGKNIPNDHKTYPMATKYTKLP